MDDTEGQVGSFSSDEKMVDDENGNASAVGCRRSAVSVASFFHGGKTCFYCMKTKVGMYLLLQSSDKFDHENALRMMKKEWNEHYYFCPHKFFDGINRSSKRIESFRVSS